MIRDAEMIGMTSLARVAAHVLTCLERATRWATPRRSARLARVGERSMHAVWELEDISV
jgi:hypothetical protein